MDQTRNVYEKKKNRITKDSEIGREMHGNPIAIAYGCLTFPVQLPVYWLMSSMDGIKVVGESYSDWETVKKKQKFVPVPNILLVVEIPELNYNNCISTNSNGVVEMLFKDISQIGESKKSITVNVTGNISEKTFSNSVCIDKS